MSPNNSQRVSICGMEIDNVSFSDIFPAIGRLLSNGGHHYLVTPNVDHVITFQKDTEFRDIYTKAALVLADGMPLIWAARFLGTPLKEKISGSDLFPKICVWCGKEGYKVFLLGGRPGAAEKAAQILKSKTPTLQIAGHYCPPFGFENSPEEEAKIAAILLLSKPDILFVGLGSPKQERWISRNCQKLGIPLSIGIGVSFEFVAGMVKRAPVWMQKSGLEWLWRLLMEPRRLWRRYLVEDTKFLGLVLAQKRRKSGEL